MSSSKPSPVPFFDDAALAWFESAFPRIEVKPDTTVNAIMYDAGIQYVLTQVRLHSAKQRNPVRA